MVISRFHISNKVLLMVAVSMLFLCFADSTWASTSGGGLPFDSWFTKIRSSVTGPFAFTVSIVGMVGAGAGLIFGGDMNGVLRTLIFIVLVLSFVVASQNMLSSITGAGAEILPQRIGIYKRVG